MKKIKIGLFATSLIRDYNKTRPSYWIRILQMREHYKKLGIEVYTNNYFRTYDVAILFRKPKPKYYYILRWLKLISNRVYFDTCINMFNLHEEINPKKLKVAHKIVQKADGLICASHRIAEHSKPLAKSIYVMEDPINLLHFNKQKTNINFDAPIFGWSGAGKKSIFLNKHADTISGRMLIISDSKISKVTLNFKFDYIEWNYDRFPLDLLKCDIALLPRNYNDHYNDSHSSFKVLVFAVLGIPIIANKVPSYVRLSNYYDGIVFLEDHNDSIDECIFELKKRSLCTEKVREHYSCENQAKELINFIKMELENDKVIDFNSIGLPIETKSVI